ncbi:MULTISPECIES: FAD:protein FMN transferase [Nonlabens]|uniref:FAD:protein FMN transferase n=1 Tax=Nonlabens TaxID=363408 RepID=UPI000CF45E7D|nr:FAD:protein FMN transferase [Nonlabens tegetincola]PQJ20550.1 thiamine biosynthesis protein ApbE [Nonlabens tegetincola]
MRYLSFLLLVVLATVSCKNQTPENDIQAQKFSGNAIGTYYNITLFHENEVAVEKSVDSIIEMFNSSMSTWRKGSLINQLNNEVDSVLVGKPFKEVFEKASDIYRKTDGYFDPTVGNLVNAYGFGANGEQEKIPTEKEIDSLMRFVGFHNLSLVPSKIQDSVYIKKEKPGVYMDFNAIGKGTLVDYIARWLTKQGVENYLVDIGGEVYAKGKNLERNGSWSVGIEDPKKKGNKTSYLSVVELTDKAMAGSGNYRKFKIDSSSGQEYVHTVNPLTGKAQPSQVIGVNVIANSCTLADGYATAFMAMPLEKSRIHLKNLPEIEVIIMYIDENGMLRFETTPGFKQYVKKAI